MRDAAYTRRRIPRLLGGVVLQVLVLPMKPRLPVGITSRRLAQANQQVHLAPLRAVDVLRPWQSFGRTARTERSLRERPCGSMFHNDSVQGTADFEVDWPRPALLGLNEHDKRADF